MAEFPKRGFYRHFKGRMYFVLGLESEHTEAREQLVVYRAACDRASGKHWVRPLKQFREEVMWPNGDRLPRFVWDEERNKTAEVDPENRFEVTWRQLQSAKLELMRGQETLEEKQAAVEKLTRLLWKMGAAAAGLLTEDE